MFLRRDDERGAAMVTLLLVMLVLMTLGIGTLEYGIGSQNLSRRDQDWNAALAAAEAGVDDYLFRLNENGAYWQYNKTNPPPAAFGNPAFTGFTNVPGPANDSQFKYAPDSSRITVDGTVKLTSTGRVRGTERTVTATLRRRSFIDYLYFTDFETVDPALYTGSPYTAAQAQTNCAKYFYSGRNSNCTDINFVSADVINGPLHSNDAFLTCGTPRFNGDTTTSYSGSLTNGTRYRRNTGCSGTPTFARAGDPKQVDPLTMPPSNSSLKAQTNAGRGGCLYTGPTKIVFNSNGTMTVTSPFSKNTNNGCVTNGTGSLPSNGVIFVQNVPSSTSDPNYTNGCPYSVSGRSHPLGLPISNDISTYGCRNGDAFVEGTVKGQVTLAADNNVVITWDLTFQGGLAGSDLLGLVANNYVEVYHPVRCTSGTSSTCNLAIPGRTVMNGLRIDAAILSVNHSFRVQNWNIGSPLGTLTVNGAIAQRYRGAVGTNSGGSIVSGFAKAYVYDQRLKYLEPPYFLDPVAAAWQVAVWSEVSNPA